MSSYSNLRIASGDFAARAMEAKARLWGDTIANLSAIPSQIMQQRTVQKRQDALLLLEQAKEARAAGDAKRADLLFQQSQDAYAKQQQIALAAFSTDGQTWDTAAAVQKAQEIGRPDLAAWATEQGEKLKPKPLPRGAPGSMAIGEGGIPVPESQVPEPPKPLTLGEPKPMMIGGKRQMVRTGSDNKLYDIRSQPITEGVDILPDEPPMSPYQKARLKFEADKAAAAAGDKTDLTPEGIDIAADLFWKTGQLPALGMGDKTTRKAIINRAAARHPDADIASNKAELAANSATLTQLEKQRAAIGAFEQTASKNIDIFLETAGKVVDSGSPLANTYLRMATGKLLGSPNQTQYDAARQVVVNEVAKIITNPNLSGQLSDAARKEVEAFNPAGATLKQSVAVMRLLKRDMQNRTDALDDQINAIRKRIKTLGAPEGGVKILKIEKVP
jgi:hypothetical protein